MILSLEEIGGERRSRMEKAVEGWKSELVDLSARNNLLYFKVSAGVLDLTQAGFTIDELLEKKSIKLVRDSSGEIDPAQIIKRSRTVLKKSQIALEEKGIETMWLGYGMATWDEDASLKRPDINAPVVLIPVSLTPPGRRPWSGRGG
jgi:hypothetical protein